MVKRIVGILLMAPFPVLGIYTLYDAGGLEAIVIMLVLFAMIAAFFGGFVMVLSGGDD